MSSSVSNSIPKLTARVVFKTILLNSNRFDKLGKKNQLFYTNMNSKDQRWSYQIENVLGRIIIDKCRSVFKVVV